MAGYDAQEFSYVLAADTYAPMEMELENNPGQVGEQTVTVRFSMSDTAADCDFTLEALMKRQSEAFEKFRDSSFSLEELVGEPLPEIALPTGNGGHYVHHRGEAMPATTVLVFLESGLGSASEVVQAVRDAIAMVPSAAEVVWLFSDRRVDDVAPLVGRELPGETTVLNSGEALRDFARWLYENRENDNVLSTREECGKYLWWLWEKGASLEAINWYIKERSGKNDHGVMASEFPSDDVEAFVHSGTMVFDKYQVEEFDKRAVRLVLSVMCMPMETRENRLLKICVSMRTGKGSCGYGRKPKKMMMLRLLTAI